MIILKGQVPHTTDTQLHKTFTKKKKKKNLVEKERQQKKAKYTSIKQRKAKAYTKLSDNLYSKLFQLFHLVSHYSGYQRRNDYYRRVF